MGAMGLPGDLSSASRFVRAAFVRENAVSKSDEMSSVSQFFHILGSVEQVRGCVLLDGGKYEITAYTSCINLSRGIYYYTTYENRAISAVDLFRCDLGGGELCRFSLQTEQNIKLQN
jgi:choloylglycine hydrolase